MPPTSKNLGSGARDLNVLLVEDVAADVGFLTSLLGDARLRIHMLAAVRTLEGALQALADPDKAFDVVLLDLGLPDTSGLDGAARITRAAPHIPIIVLTAADDDDLATRAATQDIQDYLVKWEFDPPLLARSIRYAVERHQLRMQLTAEKECAQQASRAKGEFLANMSHEIRAPMNIVLGMADLLRAGPLSPAQNVQLGRLQQAGDVLMDLIENVLDLSRIEAGRTELESEAFSLPDLVAAVAEIMRPAASAKGLALTATAHPDVQIIVLGDARRLRQVLLNLVGNAIKFTDRGTIELLANRTPDGRVAFQVRDTGPGIPPERLASVFDQFAQADASVARTHGGFGLGLSIASNLVRLMGGTISVDSQVGLGTTFSVDMRFEAPKRTASGTMVKTGVDVNALESALASRRTPIRVLLVDDSTDNQDLVRAYVADLPIVVRCVSSGGAALREFAADVFDLVLVDMHMPEMDGCETLRALRAQERVTYAEPTPMLGMSADVLTERIERAREAGCDGYLSKPARRVTLLEAILRYCGEGDRVTPSIRADAQSPDPALLAILPRFLRNRRADCATMRQAAEAGNFRQVRILAHNLKGTGASFGFPDLSVMGGELEKLGKAGDAARILPVLDAVVERLDAAMRRLDQGTDAQSDAVNAASTNGRHQR